MAKEQLDTEETTSEVRRPRRTSEEVEALVLGCLDREPKTMAAIVEESGVCRNTTWRTLKSLVEQGKATKAGPGLYALAGNAKARKAKASEAYERAEADFEQRKRAPYAASVEPEEAPAPVDDGQLDDIDVQILLAVARPELARRFERLLRLAGG